MFLKIYTLSRVQCKYCFHLLDIELQSVPVADSVSSEPVLAKSEDVQCILINAMIYCPQLSLRHNIR